MHAETINRARGRWMLVGLFAMFFLPVLMAVIGFSIDPGWSPFGTVNRGELLAPPRELSLAQSTGIEAGAEGPVGLTDRLQGQWTLLHASSTSCTDACDRTLTAMRQARLALGKDADRVSRLWLAGGRAADEAASVSQRFPGMLVTTDRVLLSELPQDASDAVYVLDPAGLLILRYAGDSVAEDILKDLKRLLKISKQG